MVVIEIPRDNRTTTVYERRPIHDQKKENEKSCTNLHKTFQQYVPNLRLGMSVNIEKHSCYLLYIPLLCLLTLQWFRKALKKTQPFPYFCAEKFMFIPYEFLSLFEMKETVPTDLLIPL